MLTFNLQLYSRYLKMFSQLLQKKKQKNAGRYKIIIIVSIVFIYYNYYYMITILLYSIWFQLVKCENVQPFLGFWNIETLLFFRCPLHFFCGLLVCIMMLYDIGDCFKNLSLKKHTLEGLLCCLNLTLTLDVLNFFVATVLDNNKSKQSQFLTSTGGWIFPSETQNKMLLHTILRAGLHIWIWPKWWTSAG